MNKLNAIYSPNSQKSTIESKPEVGQHDEHYLFSESDFERARMNKLNEIYNPNSQKVLAKYLKPVVSVLEVGPGDGELGIFISKQIGNEGKYCALDINPDLLKQLTTKIPNAITVANSVTEIETIKELQGTKFDVIYFRWLFAYIPKDKYISTLKKLYNLLNDGGHLIGEECNLYKAYCSKTDEPKSKISQTGFDEWKQLSRDVQNTKGIDAEFEMGKKIKALVGALDDGKNIEFIKFQPILRGIDKELPILGMKAAKTFIASSKIRSDESVDKLISELKNTQENDEVEIGYLKNTTAIVTKPAKNYDSNQ